MQEQNPKEKKKPKTKEQIKLEATFNLFSQGKPYIDTEQLRHVIQTYGGVPTKAELQKMIREVNASKDIGQKDEVDLPALQ